MENSARRPDRQALLLWAVTVGLLVVAIVCVFVLPGFLAPDASSLKHIDRTKLENDIRTTLVQGVAGLLVVIGGIAAWRQLRLGGQQIDLTREGQLTERYAKAVEQVGDPSRAIQIGGMHALDRIASDPRVDRLAIREVLAAYVREHSPWPPDEFSRFSARYSLSALPPLQARADGVQTAMTILGRISGSLDIEGRPVAARQSPNLLREAERLILSRVDLRKLYLRGAILRNVDFKKAHLELSDLADADLSYSRLEGAYLRGTVLSNARLTQANLLCARLEGAHLESAELSKAELWDAHLEGAFLINANLRDANVRNASFHGAQMFRCDLTGVRGLELAKGLTREQLDHAIR